MKHLITTICLLAVTTAFVTPDECHAGSRKQRRSGSGNSPRQRSSGNSGNSRFGSGRQKNHSGGSRSFRPGQNKKARFTKSFSNGGQNGDRHNSGFRKDDSKNLLSKFKKDH